MRKSLFVLLLLFGCASPEERRSAADAKVDAAYSQCAGIFKPGTEAHYRCTRELVFGNEPPRSQTTTCRPDGYGGTRCTTR